MSAFIMEDRFFNELATELLSHTTDNSLNGFQYDIRNFVGYDYKASQDEIIEAIRSTVQELMNANYAAVNDRYEDSDEIAGFVSEPFYRIPQWSDIQLIKYLQCLSYQMAEGDVINSDIYKRLEAFKGDLALTVLGASEEYDHAKWDYSQEVAYA